MSRPARPHETGRTARPAASTRVGLAGRRHGTRPRGFGAITVLMVLVVLAALVAGIVQLASATAANQALDIGATRAWLAARAGTDWGLYQALRGGWTTCTGASQTLDLRADTGLWVTVSCQSQTYNEGEDSSGTPVSVRAYVIEAVACNGTAACPDNTRAVLPGYLERKRQVQVVR